MKPSSLTLQDLTFLTVLVEVNVDYKGRASEFDFEGALIRSSIRHGPRTEDGLNWWVGVDFAMRSEEAKPVPYTIVVKAAGMFGVQADVPAEKRELFVYENGAALVYGAIREMVSGLSARSAHGALMLPTASFFGSFAEYQAKLREKDSAQAAAPTSETPPVN